MKSLDMYCRLIQSTIGYSEYKKYAISCLANKFLAYIEWKTLVETNRHATVLVWDMVVRFQDIYNQTKEPLN